MFFSVKNLCCVFLVMDKCALNEEHAFLWMVLVVVFAEGPIKLVMMVKGVTITVQLHLVQGK